MSRGCWKLFDDGDSAIVNGTPFRVAYFLNETAHFLYFRTKEEAFRFVQDSPELERPEIKNVADCEYLYPLLP